MQDFTKPLAASNAAPTAKTKWLTKDRFWNFVFWFGMSFGMASAVFAKTGLGLIALSKIIMCSTIILVPLSVVFASKTRFIQEDIFVNSEGIIITKEQKPKATFLALLAGAGLAFAIAETVLPKENGNFWAALLFFTSLFSGISLYFIYKNCPISILFNRKAWSCEKADISNQNSKLFDDSFSSRASNRDSNDIIYNPAYSSLSSNIYHRHR